MAGNGPLGALTPGFKEDLCGIFTNFDLKECLMTWCCMGIVAGLTRTHIDGRECGIGDCICGPSPYHIRQAIRQKNGVEKNALMDCLAICLCPLCVVHQNAKEAGAKFIPSDEEYKRL